MKVKILVVSTFLAAMVFLAGAGTALADGRHRGGQAYKHHRQHVVVHHVHHKVAHRPPKMAYGRIIPAYPYRHAPVYHGRRPVVVKHAPPCGPVHAGWGFSIRFGW